MKASHASEEMGASATPPKALEPFTPFTPAAAPAPAPAPTPTADNPEPAAAAAFWRRRACDAVRG
jgi:hypothetical protein